jgi:hypothetical protein
MDDAARLNLFARMMLRWRDLHPYNPVHVVRIPAVLEPARLKACIAERLEALGLTGLALDRGRWRLRFAGGPAKVELAVERAGADPFAALSRTIESEFNLPFPAASDENPFRFIAIDEGNAFQLLLVYDHYVASGDSVARLLTGVACAYAEGASLPPPAPMECASRTYRGVFLRHPLWSLRATLGLARMVASARRACRPRYADVEDTRNAFTYARLGPPQAGALLGAARAWGVTLNELVMASLLLALAPLAAERRREPRRNELAVASILNMRQDFGPDVRDALGPFLAAFRVSHAVPDGIGLRQLAEDVHAAAVRVKSGHLYLQSIVALAASALLWPWLSQPRRHRLYAKHFPVWAGVTSLNMNSIWSADEYAGAARLDYLRAVPTGPLCPLVLAVTTAHGAMHIGIAFRTAAYSRAAVDGLAAELTHCAERLRVEAVP